MAAMDAVQVVNNNLITEPSRDLAWGIGVSGASGSSG
jgi:hypothetical protein